VNAHRSSPLSGLSAENANDAEALRVLDSYLSGIEAGRPADPHKLLADHPALADQLRAYLKVMHLAGRMAENSAARPRVRAAVPYGDGQTPPLANGREGWSDQKPPIGTSHLSTLDFGPGPPPHIKLRELLEDRDPLVMPRSAEMPDQDGAGLGRYQLRGEIARGGMGAIIRGRDVDLGRELAIKVLLESHQGNPEVVRRFVEEAQIGGQLQHPGVVPVYEMGTFPDRRPYFAMKLVKGQTLAALLRERTSPAHNLPRFLRIFEQACYTMAYAHARGVIHRDLKPSNVMVGSFGEVQVMDWGLAKVLTQGGIADEAAAQAVQETVVTTVRSGPIGTDSESEAGSILGTPAYMAPEQARGQVERIDERADVFGLGAILCEILTGWPPYIGSNREIVRAQAARGDLADAWAGLDESGVDVELISLARNCLAPDPEQRPRSAGEVARRLTACREGVQERLRVAEWARVEAQARAEEQEKRRLVADQLAREARAREEEERKRRRLTVALAASVLVTAGVIVGGWTFLTRQQTVRLAATTRVVTEALADAERLRGQAQSAALGDLTKWSEARAAADRARGLLAEGEADDALSARVKAALADLEREQATAVKGAAEVARDRALLSQLETIRGNASEHWNPKRTDIDYAAAFRAFGIDLDQLDPEEAGKQIAQRSEPVELASYLDDWAVKRRKARDKRDEATWRRLLAAARTADRHPWRVALRDQIGGNDLEALRRLADDQRELEAQSPTSLVLLAVGLIGRGDRERAERVLRLAWRLDPRDFWVNYELAEVHQIDSHYKRPEEAIRFDSAAVAIRPRSFAAHMSLGIALKDARKLEEATTELRAAARLGPDFAYARNNLGAVLAEQGKFEEAMVEFRAALRLDPDYASPHDGLGNVLLEQGKLAESEVEFRTALRLMPDFALAHNNLGAVLRIQGKLDEAIAESRAALRLLADFPEAQFNIGLSLRSQGEFAEAVGELRKALDMAAKNSDIAQRIGRVLAVTERQASVAAMLPAVLAGKIEPGDTAETLDFAQICYNKQLHGASARFWAGAFQSEPKLADDMPAHRRYDAACAAALAGCGQGKDKPPLDEASRTRWRQQALEWLKADLAAWSKVLESGPPQSRQTIAQTLKHWKVDPDLAGLRDNDALAKFTEDEQNTWRALWAQVDALLAKTCPTISPDPTGRRHT
jgi:serine/threonine protein kinase/Tfp pilus assembly protein PilF